MIYICTMVLVAEDRRSILFVEPSTSIKVLGIFNGPFIDTGGITRVLERNRIDPLKELLHRLHKSFGWVNDHMDRVADHTMQLAQAIGIPDEDVKALGGGR